MDEATIIGIVLGCLVAMATGIVIDSAIKLAQFVQDYRKPSNPN
jgi:hypothetical protein